MSPDSQSERFEVYKDAAGKWRWRLVAPNGKIIATGGESYASKQMCELGIPSVKRNARARVGPPKGSKVAKKSRKRR